jgi:SAM-dependent methyltransferase
VEGFLKAPIHEERLTVKGEEVKVVLKRALPHWVIRFLRRELASLKQMSAYPKLIVQFSRFKSLATGHPRRLAVRFRDLDLNAGEDTSTTNFDHHYVYHPAWAARVLAQTKPVEHIDISSTLHFCSMVSAFVHVKFYDYRPAALQLSNLQCGHADLTNLPFADGSISSLSCMHTVEHLGLGRYGDALDVDGDVLGMNELKRVLACGGNLLFAVPIGRPKVIFNAHRIYSYDQIIQHFADLELQQFALITDTGMEDDFILSATKAMADQQTYGCGCFWFKKVSR